MPKFVNQIIRQPWFRAVGIPAYRFYARQWRGFSDPKVAAISLPKAGTHLLSRVLNQLPQMMFSGYHLSEEDVFHGEAGTASASTLDQKKLTNTINRCLPGQYFTGHFPAVDALRGALIDEQVAILFIVRDPRDIVVSYVHYVLSEPRHFHHRYYHDAFTTFDQRLTATITGFERNEQTELGLAPIGIALTSYAGWLHDPQVTVCRFEDLIGSQGGGSDNSQRDTIRKISVAAGRACTDEQVEIISQRVFSKRSRTFRKGAAGDWSSSFNNEHRAMFKEQAGDLLIDYGYESTTDW